MEKYIDLFEEYLNKTIDLSELILSMSLDETENLFKSIENRERLLEIINKISLQIEWKDVDLERRLKINQLIEFIKKLDENLLEKLQIFKQDLRDQIKTTFKQKENIKGYNLNQTK